MKKVEYDQYGRMKFNPIFHYNNGTLWNEEDLEYLIKWFDKIGPDEMSFALGRTMGTIQQKVTILRRRGIMSNKRIERHNRTHCNDC
jgi:hypothetical protein